MYVTVALRRSQYPFIDFDSYACSNEIVQLKFDMEIKII